MVYVLNKDNSPLMPCTESKARKLLKSGRAKVKFRCPFTIKLLWGCEGSVQKVIAGMDAGSKVIGVACQSNGKILYKAETILRQDIHGKMEQRKMYRRSRRGRKTRYRQARWRNRRNSKKSGRYAPSVMSKIVTHFREKNFVESLLPVSSWVVETVSFDIHRISDLSVSGSDYQNGQQKGFYNVKAYVLDRDGHSCKKCKKSGIKLHVHHVVPRSNGGSNEPKNLITLCAECHEALHKGEFTIKGKVSLTKHATEVSVVSSVLRKCFGKFTETFGSDTKYIREQLLHLPKTHYNDAIAICLGENIVKQDSCGVLYRRCVSKGDYQQTKGKRSEIKIPTGKLYGLRKFDKIKTPKVSGFIKGKRSSGYFAVSDIFGILICSNASVKHNCERIQSRKTIIMEDTAPPRPEVRGHRCV